MAFSHLPARAETEREGERDGAHGPLLVFPAASAPPRQTDFIWRIKQMHLEIALSLSLSANLALSLLLPCSPSLCLSFSLSPDCSD